MQVYALTLGVNAYKDPHIPPLQCSSHDAREFAHVLRDGLGYHAQCMEEQKTKEIEQRIIQVGKRLKPGDLFVFYFAGHSKSDGVDTYFLLTGAHLNELHEVSDTDNGVLRFRHLKQITSGPGWEGVQRLFVFDDCSGIYTSIEANLTVINSCDPGYGALKLPDLQKTVMAAVQRRLRYLEKVATVLHFTDHGQDFLRWELDAKGKVIGCGPFQGFIWKGKHVMNHDLLRAGDTVHYRSMGDSTSVDNIRYPLALVERKEGSAA